MSIARPPTTIPKAACTQVHASISTFEPSDVVLARDPAASTIRKHTP